MTVWKSHFGFGHISMKKRSNYTTWRKHASCIGLRDDPPLAHVCPFYHITAHPPYMLLPPPKLYMIEGKSLCLIHLFMSVLLGRMKTFILTQLEVFYEVIHKCKLSGVCFPSMVFPFVMSGKENRILSQTDTSSNP